MQSVNERWYKIYSWVATVLAILLMLGCIIGWLSPSTRFLATQWGLSYVTFGIAFSQVVYFLTLYKNEAKNSYSAATFILIMIQAINIINLIHTTGGFHSWFFTFWAFAVLMGGMFGLYSVVGCSFLVTIYFILSTNVTLGAEAPFDRYSLAGLFGTYLLSFISYFLWRKQYMDQESAQVAKLSGDLKSKQQQTAILIQSITDGMIVINTEGKINTLNPAASKMTEWPIEEASGIDVQLVVKLQHENGEKIPSNENPFVLALTKKESANSTLQLVGRDGKQLIVSLAVSPVLMPNKSQDLVGAVAVIRDVSASHAEEAQRAEFISTASHEMRTPVAAIEGYLALALNDKVSQIDSKAREYLEKAHASTKHLGKLFQDLLTSAKAEDGRLVSHPVVVEMGEFLEQITDSLKFAASSKGLFTEFIVGTSPVENSSGGGKVIKPLYYVHVDPDRLREVITNIFDNAVKYTPDGKISIGLTGNSEVVQLYVRDTGPGIAQEDIPHLFQKFYRVDNSATRTIGGTGLGLFICRKIIELYKGRIWVESQSGQGSTFYINLPRLNNQKASELQTAEARQLPSLPSSVVGTGSFK